MLHTKGYVSYAGNNLFRGKKLFSFRVATEDKFFGTGLADHGLNKGDFVDFDYEERNGRFEVDVLSIKKSNPTEPAPTSAGKAPARSGSSFGAAKDGYWEDKAERDLENDRYRRENDRTIQYQSARNASISVVSLLLENKALKLSEKGDNAAIILGKISDLTNKFNDECAAYKDKDDKVLADALPSDNEIPY